MSERWYAERRTGVRQYERHPDQPEDGFDSIGGVIDFLLDKGEIEWAEHPEGAYLKRWGNPWHAKVDRPGDGPPRQLRIVRGGGE